MGESIQVQRKIDVKIPRTPNFIQCGKAYMSIFEFTDEELQRIGEMWTALLIERARKKRQKDTP